MKRLFVFALLLFVFNLVPGFCGDKVKACLVSIGTGKTYEEARLSSVRNAVEQTCGVFVFSSTQMENQSLVLDKILTSSSGKITSYKELSCGRNENGDYVVSAEIAIGVTELCVAAKKTGLSSLYVDVSDIKDSYIVNLNLEKLYKKNEDVIIQQLISDIGQYIENDIFDVQQFSHSEPIYNYTRDKVKFVLEAKLSYNKLLADIDNLLYSSISSLSSNNYNRLKSTNEGAAFEQKQIAPIYYGFNNKCKVFLSPHNVKAITTCIGNIFSEIERYSFLSNGKVLNDMTQTVHSTGPGVVGQMIKEDSYIRRKVKDLMMPKSIDLYLEAIYELSTINDRLDFECKKI